MEVTKYDRFRQETTREQMDLVYNVAYYIKHLPDDNERQLPCFLVDINQWKTLNYRFTYYEINSNIDNAKHTVQLTTYIHQQARKLTIKMSFDASSPSSATKSKSASPISIYLQLRSVNRGKVSLSKTIGVYHSADLVHPIDDNAFGL
ncbi:hypothetical protein ABG067_004237 [Albugo candida]